MRKSVKEPYYSWIRLFFQHHKIIIFYCKKLIEGHTHKKSCGSNVVSHGNLMIVTIRIFQQCLMSVEICCIWL